MENFLLYKPYRLFLLFFIIFRVFIVVSRDNWLIVWIGMEINLYRFIPLILLDRKNQEKEARIKYFIFQRIPSAILVLRFLFSLLNIVRIHNMICLSLIIKIGVAPVHFWLPSVINSVNWVICWILSTIQKLAPIFLVIYFSFSPYLIIWFSIFSSIVGGLGGINQTIIRVLLAYSSIGQIGWILGGSLISKIIRIIYLLSYIIIISRIFLFLNYIKIRSRNFNILIKKSIRILYIFRFLIIRLGGLPPFLGFFPKLMVIQGLVDNNFYFFRLILILGSVINLYYYLKLIFIFFLINVKRDQLNFKIKIINIKFLFIINLRLSIFGILIFIKLFIL